jgi:hypothetical protein
MNTPTKPLKFKRIRAGWYESGPNETEGTYVVTNDDPGSWIVRRWTTLDGYLDYEFIESTGTYADAKYYADFDNRTTIRNGVNQ